MRSTKKILSVAVFIFLVLAIFPAQSFASRSRSRSIHRSRRHSRHVTWAATPASLRGSRASLVRQNAEIDRLDLPRIDDDDELDDLVQQKKLVGLPTSAGVRIDPRLDEDRRYCKPWTRDFLRDLGGDFRREFGGTIQVNSAVRTVEQQKKLRRRNGNAAPIEGSTASSHLAGLTVDIAKKGLSRKQHRWMQSYFANLRSKGLIEVAEERRQAVFHVMVSQKYANWREAQQLAEKK
jgi:uncharacterized protein DUF5715